MSVLLRIVFGTVAISSASVFGARRGVFDYVTPGDAPPVELNGETLCVDGGVLTTSLSANDGSEIVSLEGIATDSIYLSESWLRMQGGYARRVIVDSGSQAVAFDTSLDEIDVWAAGSLIVQGGHANGIVNLGQSTVIGGSVNRFDAAGAGPTVFEGALVAEFSQSGPAPSSMLGGYVARARVSHGNLAIATTSIDRLRAWGSPSSRVAMFSGAINQEAVLGQGTSFTLLGGGIHGDLLVGAGASMTISGERFLIDGDPIEGLLPGVPHAIDDRDATLTAELHDGAVFQREVAPSIAADADLWVVLGKAGDFNADDMVDAADYVYWRDNFDNDRSPVDPMVWRSNFGLRSPRSTQRRIVIPEPGAVLLSLLAASACLSRHRRAG